MAKIVISNDLNSGDIYINSKKEPVMNAIQDSVEKLTDIMNEDSAINTLILNLIARFETEQKFEETSNNYIIESKKKELISAIEEITEEVLSGFENTEV